MVLPTFTKLDEEPLKNMAPGNSPPHCSQKTLWPERPLSGEMRPLPDQVYAAVRAFEFDMPALAERSEYGRQQLEKLIRLAEGRASQKGVSDDEGIWYLRLASELRLRHHALFWEYHYNQTRVGQKGKLSQASLAIPYRGECVQVAVTSKGDLHSARHVTLLIPGYSLDARGHRPTLEEFEVQPGEAILSISIFGGGTRFPQSIRPDPQALTEIYYEAIRRVAPNVDSSGGLTIGGTSMGAMVALGVVLKLKKEGGVVANYIADNPMLPSVLSDMEALKFHLIRPLRWLGFGLEPNFGMTFGLAAMRGSMLDDIFGDRTDPDWSPSREEIIYNDNHLTMEPQLRGAYSVAGLMAEIAYEIDQWDEYLAREFPKFFARADDDPDQIARLVLPGMGVVSHARGDKFFETPGPRKFYKTLRDSHPDAEIRIYWLESPHGSHVERDARFLRAIELVRAQRLRPR